jgi:actin-related protein
MRYFLTLLLMSFFLFSCEGDDDVCVSGEATARMKIKFKSADNKLMTLDNIYVDVDYGGTSLVNVVSKAKADSILVPLRVDNNSYTEIFVRTQEKGTVSKLKISYDTKSKYVSPACGFKREYENVKAVLETPNPVTNIELNQNQIINENKTHLYLVF